MLVAERNRLYLARQLLNKIHCDDNTPVYTIHAEVEGIGCLQNFSALLKIAKEEGIQFCPLSELLPNDTATLPAGKIVRGTCPGREGWIGLQYTGCNV